MSNNSCAPLCNCGQDSVYVDNGPRLQYYYCRSCKVEVGLQEPPRLAVPDAALRGLTAWLPSPTPAQAAQTMYLVVAVDYHRGEVHITEHPQAKGAAWTVDFTNFSGNRVPNPGDVLHGFSFPRPTPGTQAPSSYAAQARTPGWHDFAYAGIHSPSKTCRKCGVDEMTVVGGYASYACGGTSAAVAATQPGLLSKVSPLVGTDWVDAMCKFAASVKEKEWD